MLSFLFKKESRVEELIYDYLDNFVFSKESFEAAFHACIEQGAQSADFEFHLKQTHKHESRADDIREEINNLMYSKALIPDSRGDIMRLLEAIDRIPQLFETTLFIIQTQQIDIPEIIRADTMDLLRISLECCDLMVRQAKALFKNTGTIRSLLKTIDAHESHCDHFERRIITKIFASPQEPFFKLQIKDLVLQIGEISDQADRVSKQINIISLKRRV